MYGNKNFWKNFSVFRDKFETPLTSLIENNTLQLIVELGIVKSLNVGYQKKQY